jgi:hypothetical protein
MSTSTPLRQFKQSYLKRGTQDVHINIFQSVHDEFGPFERVLYPGCHRHISASVVFPSVVYVDSDRKVTPVYDDSATDEWIAAKKTYTSPTNKELYCGNYESLPSSKFPIESFDLLISLSAGVVSTPCGKYVKKQGYLLVNDSHSDARVAFLDPRFKLVAAWDEEKRTFRSDDEELQQHFHLKFKDGVPPTPMSRVMVNESVRVGTKSMRSFRLQKEGMFYLFRREDADTNGDTDAPVSKKPRHR